MRTSPSLAPFLACSLLVPAAAAQDPVPVGPLGAACHGLRVDPDDTGSLVAAVHSFGAGLWRSGDGGATWSAAEMVPAASFSHGVAGSGASSDRVVAIAGTAVYVSEDDGQSFALVHDFGTTLTRLATHPTEDVWMVADSEEMWRSGDGGATWESVFTVSPFAPSIAHEPVFAPSDPDVAYFCTFTDLYRSFDAGATWEPSPLDPGGGELAVDPQGSGGIRVAQTGQVWASTNGGDSWTSFAAPLVLTSVEEIAFEPASPPRLWAGMNDGSVYVHAGGNQWTEKSGELEGALGTAAVQARQLVFAGGDAWLATTYGIWRASGADLPWTQLRLALQHLGAAAVAEPGGLRLVGGSTVFGGEALVDFEALLDPYVEPSVRAIAVDPKDPSRWFVGLSEGGVAVPLIEVTGDGAAYQHVSCGGSCGHGAFVDVEFDPFDEDHVLVAVQGATAHHVAFTLDDGATWGHLTGLPTGGTVALSFDPFEAGRVLAFSADGRIFESLHGGLDWKANPSPPVAAGPGELEFDPFVPGRAYRASASNGWERSDDGGSTWNPLGNPLGMPASHASTVELHPHQPGLAWFAAEDEVRLSGDFGATSVPVFASPEGSDVSALALDAADGSLVVATWGESAFVLDAHSPYLQIGAGTPGTGAEVPEHFALGGLPQVGNAAWGLAAANVGPGELVVLAVGATEVAVPIFGGAFLPGPPYPVLTTAVADGAGEAAFTLPLPANAALIGLPLTSQIAASDPGATGGFALSPGLRTKLM